MNLSKISVGDTLRYDVFISGEGCCFENSIVVYILNHPKPDFKILEFSENYAICHDLNRPMHHVVALPRNQIICLDTWDILRIESKDRTERFQEHWNRLFAAKLTKNHE